jgi:cytochrome c-type biogenesis protein
MAAALLWGVLSILLSPCHLAGIPLLVGYISRDPKASTAKAFRTSAAFTTGVLVSIAAVGILTIGAGRIAGDTGRAGGMILAIVLMLLGLNLMDVFTIPVPSLTAPGGTAAGAAGAALYGMVFGAAAGPCTFAFTAPLLGVALAAQTSEPAFAAGLVGSFALGHGGVILLAGTFSRAVCRLLRWNEGSGVLRIMRRAAGVLVILAGLYLLRKAA